MIEIAVKKTLKSSTHSMMLDISLQIQQHQFVAISGKSGSGKTTLLRVLSGLENSEGIISVDGEIWQDENKTLAVQKRKIGFVFQEYALFENMSVLDNLLYVKKDKALALSLLDMTHMGRFKELYPKSLSGGQKQRVALCRAFMNSPQLLLLDEPLSALDPQMRLQLQEDILRLHKKFKTTTIMVSHDPSEIYKLASRVVVLEDGKIVEDGLPKDVLLQSRGSQKFSLEGELLDIIKRDVIYVGVVAIGAQIVEIVLDESEAKSFDLGQRVRVSAKAFSPSISKI